MLRKKRYLAIPTALILGLVMVAVVTLRASVLAADGDGDPTEDLVKTSLIRNWTDYSWPWATSETWPGKISHEMKDADNDGKNELYVTVHNPGSKKWDVMLRHRRLHIQEDIDPDPYPDQRL